MENNQMIINILGTGCPNCIKLENNTKKAVEDLKLDNNAEFIFESISDMSAVPENTLFVDDFCDNGILLKKSGGFFYHYDEYKNGHKKFIQWFYDNFN